MVHKEELAQLITLEQGKPLKESVGEVHNGWRVIVSFLSYVCSPVAVVVVVAVVEIVAAAAEGTN